MKPLMIVARSTTPNRIDFNRNMATFQRISVEIVMKLMERRKFFLKIMNPSQMEPCATIKLFVAHEDSGEPRRP